MNNIVAFQAEDWDSTSYEAPDGFCQTEEADFIDRMDLLFLLDLLGTPAPDFQEFVVRSISQEYSVSI